MPVAADVRGSGVSSTLARDFIIFGEVGGDRAREPSLAAHSSPYGAGKAASTLLLLKRFKRKQLVHVRVKRSPKVIAGAAVIGLLAAGGAFAWWSAGGLGTGEAATASVKDIVVTGVSSTALVPGGSTSLSGTLSNSNVTDIKVGEMTAKISGLPAGIPASDFTISGKASSDNTVLTPGDTNWNGLTLKYNNTDVDQNAGKNVKLGITYTIAPFVNSAPAVTGSASISGQILTTDYSNPAVSGALLRGMIINKTNPGAVYGGSFAVSVNGIIHFSGSVSNLGPYPLVAGNVYTIRYETILNGVAKTLNSYDVTAS